MLAAIRDASVGEGRRIRAGIPGIQGGWLYFELARVAHFEWDGAEGGSITHDGEKIDDPLNRFWFVDLEDFDESPVRAVKRHYNEGYLVGNMGRILDGFRGVEDRISDAERRRHRLLRVETDILLKAFGEIVMGVGARPEAPLHIYGPGRGVVTFSGRVVGPEARGTTGNITEAKAADAGLAVVELSPVDGSGEVQLPENVDGILGYLRDHGLDELADDLEYKKRLIEEDPDEVQICEESARRFVSFVAAEELPGSPTVTVDVDGYVGLEWVIPDPMALGSEATTRSVGENDGAWGEGDGVLGMWFLPAGMVRVYGTSGPVHRKINRMRVNETYLPEHVMSAVEPFLSRLEAR